MRRNGALVIRRSFPPTTCIGPTWHPKHIVVIFNVSETAVRELRNRPPLVFQDVGDLPIPKGRYE
jgi:hypothetical protein